ncbi:MAG: thiol peroxidase [Gammaproteobacteria bacterium]
MATITLKGNKINTSGDLPAVGSQAPEFELTNADLQDVGLKDFSGRKKLLNIFPSLDTPTCATSTRKFNQNAAQLQNVALLMISADLPFAMARFCAAEGIEQVTTLSMMRNRNFAKDYGVLINDGPLTGITARAVVVLDENNKVLYTELVPEIADEPNYDAAMKALKS